MKNEIKLNIHLFCPEQQNDDISVEQHKAFETLLALPELDQEDSVKKFTTELESRFALIKPILGDQTEEFLGYNQDDITKLADFFAGKFKRFGMDAVAVQKILRNIWLQTPCEDKRLNYKLYKFIDEKFYAIVNERKRNISFDHIPAPTDSQWETLKKDWETRRAHYAACLDIDIDYLDSEAVDGTIFPSASGLFANPSYSDWKVLEFLNFWMPLLKDEKNRSYIDFNKDKIFKKWKAFSFASFRPQWYWRYIQLFDSMTETRPVEVPEDKIKIECFNAGCNHTEITNPDAENCIDVVRQEENAWYDKVRDYYVNAQPVSFFFGSTVTKGSISKTPETKFLFCSDFEEIDDPDKLQLPNFINSCNEFVIKEGKIIHGKELKFHNGEKIYFPEPYLKDLLICADAYEAAKIELPDFNSGIQAVADYYDTCAVKMSGLEYHPNGLPAEFASDSAWKQPNIFYHRMSELFQCIIKYVDYYAEDNTLSLLYKLKVIATIKKYFTFSNSQDNFQQQLESYIDLKIGGLIKDTGIAEQQAVSFNLGDEINYFYWLQEQEKLKLQLKEAEVREKIFQQSCHQMGNLSQATSGNLDLAKQELEGISPQLDEYQYVFDPLSDAKQDIDVILQYATSISNSYRDLDDNWQDDLNKSNGKPFVDIIRQALHRSILHVFYRDITAFCHAAVSEEYFSTRKEMDEAKKSWQRSKSWDEQCEWIEKNLLKIS